MTMSLPGKHCILYLDTAPSTGGSVVSLYELLRNLDRSHYEPLVVSYALHAYVERLRALDLEVIVWDAYAEGDHRPEWVKEARGLGPVRWLRRLPWGSKVYHALGLLMLLGRRVWPRARALRNIIKRNNVALVHTNIRVGHDREGILAAEMAGIPCVSHIRDFEELDWFDRWLAGRVDAFFYISKAVQECHLRAGVAHSKGQVVYNAVDSIAFARTFDVMGTRQTLGLAANDLVVGMVSRLERWKGLEVFLHAMAIVRRRVPQARGMIVGDVVPYDREYRQSLLVLRDELGLSEGVNFCPFQGDMPMTMAALDLLVLASTSPEPFGRVLIEAMAAGKPVVATDSGAAPEIVEHGTNGLLVPAGDVQALANAIVSVLEQPERAKEMGRKGQARVQERFDVRHYVDGVEAVYRYLLR